MLTKVVKIIMDYIVTYVVIPITWIIVDYFRMKRTIKQLNVDIEKLKNAKTKTDIDSSIDNLP